MKYMNMELLIFSILLTFVSPNELPNKDYWDHFVHKPDEACIKGKSQSPIDLDPSLSANEAIRSYLLTSYSTGLKLKAENNGHTVVFTLDEKNKAKPSLSKGPLSSEYKLAQFHFHWGGNDSLGSEHTINGMQYPLEVHLVHFNTDYGSTIKEALEKTGKGDNLAVLGAVFQISPDDNLNLEPIIKSLDNVVQEKSSTNVATKFELKHLLPLGNDGVFVYNGSLTTPGCDEVVAWNVFKHPVNISSRQLEKFRNLMSHGRNLVNNFRYTQPLNSRKVRLLQ